MPLTAKIYKDLYIEEAIQTGIEVEYWDITSLFFKRTFGQEDSSHLTKTKKIVSYVDLENAIISEQPLLRTLFISIMTFEGRVGKLYRLFTKYNCTLAVFGRNMFPVPAADISSKIKRLGNFTIPKVMSFWQTIQVKKQKLNGQIKGYDFMFLGGSMGWQGIGNIDNKDVLNAKVINVNSDDYDVYLQLDNVGPLVKNDYILFLDEYLPLHPDTKLFGIRNIPPEQYYPDLCKYFDRVEAQFGMPVVIAAHPKALKYKEQNYFGGRDIHFGKSAKLSKYAFFVIAHDSTSINFPIAFGKRLHFITSENIMKGINKVHRNVVCFANYLGCNYQWFDKEGPINLIEEVPLEMYRKYKYDFQTCPETELKLSKDLFIQFLREDSTLDLQRSRNI